MSKSDRPMAGGTFNNFAVQIDRVVAPADQIARRVQALAGEISGVYGDKELTILAVLTGALIFLADLIRQLPMKMRLNVVSVCSYPGAATRSQGPRLLTAIDADLSGKDVLVVDDILDTGRTLRAILDAVAAMAPASLRTCVLLKKTCLDGEGRVRPDFVGFEVGREFLVGYGLDFDHLYRNLPDICVLARHARTGRGGQP